MSLTISMKNLTRKIEYGAKKRRTSVSSMINSYKNIRVNIGKEDRTKRILYVTRLKSDVRNMLLTDFHARKTMSSNRRRSFNFFMNNLKNSTENLLYTFREKQNLIAADVLGAKSELAGLVQLQIKNVNTSNNENSDKCLCDSDCNTDNNESSDKCLCDSDCNTDNNENSDKCSCDSDCNTDNNENSDKCSCDSDCNRDMLQLSEEVNKFESSSDAILLNTSIETSNDSDSVNQDTTVQEKSIQQNDRIESKVFDFIKDSKEGKKLVDIREFINSIDENNNVQEILFKMCNNGIIKKFRYRYYIINSNLR